MHAQIRAKPLKSAPNLEAFLAVLSEPVTPPGEPLRTAINLEGVTGGDVELGGEFVVVVPHDRESDAIAWLTGEGYKPELVEVFGERLTNQPGALLEIVRRASEVVVQNSQVIKDVLIGEETGAPGSFFVQVSFQDVKTSR